jgi:hypothetical protein
LAVDTLANLLTRANQIRTEIGGAANSASRLGGLFRDIIDSLSGFGGNRFSPVAFGASTSATGAVNDAAIAACVAAAMAANGEVVWPDGAFASSASIANLHSVRHRGPGRIVRGADTFYVDPRYGQTNRIYVSASGVSANDGLTSSQPMATPQNAFDALKNYGPVLEGTWRVVLAAGTWNGTVHRHSHTTPSQNPVIIEGPNVGGHPNVPTAIFDGATGAVSSDWAIRATGQGVQVDVRNIKAQNYTGAGTDSMGFLFDYGAVVYFDNLHGSGNSYSVFYAQGCTTIRGGGGIWSSPRGALINGCHDVTIGYGAIPVRLNSCATSGIEWSRGSEGHVDYCEFNDCGVGLDVIHNSRVHVMGCNFKRSAVSAVRTRTGGYYYNDLATPNTWNQGTADANAIMALNYNDGGESDADFWLSQGMRRRAFDKNSHNLTGTTSVTAMSTLLTGLTPTSKIPAYWFEDNTKRILVRVTGRFVTAAALSAIGVSLGGTEIDRITLTTGPAANSIFFYECEIEATAANAQFKKSRLLVDGGPVRLQQNSPAVATSVDLSLTVNGKLANAGDSMDVFWAEVWLVG